MDKILKILCGHGDTSILLQHMEGLAKAVDAALDSDSSSSSSSSSSSGSSSSSDDSIYNLEFEEKDGKGDMVKVIDKYSYAEFKANMKVKPSTAQYLIEGFCASTYMPQTSHGGRQCVDAKKSVYMYLWYVNQAGTFHQLSSMFNVSVSTTWITVKRVSSWLVSVGYEHIKWPQCPDQIKSIQKKFKRMNNIPGIIGVIGCTRIIIKCPKKDKKLYVDKNKKYSFTLQAVVDADMKFLDIACGEPGSLDDYTVLKKSGFYLQTITSVDDMFPNNSFLLGDTSYPPQPWLVSPYIDCGNLTESGLKFNELHAATRNVLKNAFSQLKMRCSKLKKINEMFNIPVLVNIIQSACILHNICITLDDLYEPTAADKESNIEDEMEADIYIDELEQDTTRRDILFNHLFKSNII